jgi:Spy/CpxP family protein refolding chaperone
MKKSVRLLALFCLAVTAFAAAAQAEPPPPPPGYGYPGQMQRPLRDWRDASPDQREQWREERRQQRRETWREMSPEERHQLRRDIRDAGRMYRRGPRRD